MDFFNGLCGLLQRIAWTSDSGILSVSRILVPDNLKTGVIEHKKYEDPVLNKSYQKMTDYYGMAIIPARVKKPRDKSVAEGSVFSVATTDVSI